ncbi:unnamed protein product [Amoebophrya sp. A120]|nr:unnamed protein product [Amoebophrya sp. A120]|eukprot:GSA120T00022933001.1
MTSFPSQEKKQKAKSPPKGTANYSTFRGRKEDTTTAASGRSLDDADHDGHLLEGRMLEKYLARDQDQNEQPRDATNGDEGTRGMEERPTLAVPTSSTKLPFSPKQKSRHQVKVNNSGRLQENTNDTSDRMLGQRTDGPRTGPPFEDSNSSTPGTTSGTGPGRRAAPLGRVDGEPEPPEISAHTYPDDDYPQQIHTTPVTENDTDNSYFDWFGGATTSSAQLSQSAAASGSEDPASSSLLLFPYSRNNNYPPDPTTIDENKEDVVAAAADDLQNRPIHRPAHEQTNETGGSSSHMWDTVTTLLSMLSNRRHGAQDFFSFLDPSVMWRLRDVHSQLYEKQFDNAAVLREKSILIETMIACLYMRAVYGVPMYEGYVDSAATWVAGAFMKVNMDQLENEVLNQKAFLALVGAKQDSAQWQRKKRIEPSSEVTTSSQLPSGFVDGQELLPGAEQKSSSTSSVDKKKINTSQSGTTSSKRTTSKEEFLSRTSSPSSKSPSKPGTSSRKNSKTASRTTVPGRHGTGATTAATGGAAAAPTTSSTSSPTKTNAFLPANPILVSAFTEEMYEPAFVLSVNHTLKWLILSVRGSMAWKDVMTDIAAEEVDFAVRFPKAGSALFGVDPLQELTKARDEEKRRAQEAEALRRRASSGEAAGGPHDQEPDVASGADPLVTSDEPSEVQVGNDVVKVKANTKARSLFPAPKNKSGTASSTPPRVVEQDGPTSSRHDSLDDAILGPPASERKESLPEIDYVGNEFVGAKSPNKEDYDERGRGVLQGGQLSTLFQPEPRAETPTSTGAAVVVAPPSRGSSANSTRSSGQSVQKTRIPKPERKIRPPEDEAIYGDEGLFVPSSPEGDHAVYGQHQLGTTKNGYPGTSSTSSSSRAYLNIEKKTAGRNPHEPLLIDQSDVNFAPPGSSSSRPNSGSPERNRERHRRKDSTDSKPKNLSSLVPTAGSTTGEATSTVSSRTKTTSTEDGQRQTPSDEDNTEVRVLFRTHKGFVKSAEFVYGRIRFWVERFLKKNPDYRFVFTGHSLGAATVALVYWKFPQIENKRLFLFGSPAIAYHDDDAEQGGTVAGRSPGRAANAAKYPVMDDPRILGVVRGKDFVSALSMESFDRLADEISETSYFTQAVDYIGTLFGQQRKTHDYSKIPRPPGKFCLHLQVRPSTAAPTCFWVRNHGEHYRRILLGLRMIDDHLPNLYLATLCDVYFHRFFDRNNVSTMEYQFLKMLKRIRFDYIQAYEAARWI